LNKKKDSLDKRRKGLRDSTEFDTAFLRGDTDLDSTTGNMSGSGGFFFKEGFFGFFLFMYDIQHCLICRPSDATVSEDAGIEPRTRVADPDPDWIRIQSGQSESGPVRIRIRNPDPDPGGQK
jgi:hypothetical protein